MLRFDAFVKLLQCIDLLGHTAKVMKGIERREPPTDVERAAREINERGRSITRILPRPLQPRGPEGLAFSNRYTVSAMLTRLQSDGRAVQVSHGKWTARSVRGSAAATDPCLKFRLRGLKLSALSFPFPPSTVWMDE